MDVNVVKQKVNWIGSIHRYWIESRTEYLYNITCEPFGNAMQPNKNVASRYQIRIIFDSWIQKGEIVSMLLIDFILSNFALKV
jgi:hypothetical protein